MITEALLDKIKALISGYKQPAHPLYGKSDKEVAEVIKSMVSGYLTESKQLIVEKNWKPPGVDPAKTYSGTRFPSKNYKNTFLKFKQELKDIGSINPTFVAFGIDTHKILNRFFRNEFSIVKLTHYSNYQSKENYRKEVLEKIKVLEF